MERRELEDKIIEKIKTIYDPEIPVNIYELGLIYGIDFISDEEVKVTMTLTSPSCPVAESLPGEVRLTIEELEEIKSAEINLVFDPPWDKSMMSEEAQLELGFL